VGVRNPGSIRVLHVKHQAARVQSQQCCRFPWRHNVLGPNRSNRLVQPGSEATWGDPLFVARGTTKVVEQRPVPS